MAPVTQLELLIAYAAIVIPLGTTVVELLTLHSASPRARGAAVLLWLGGPGLLAAICIEGLRLIWLGQIPVAFGLLLVATTLSIGLGYLIGGRLLVQQIDVALHQRELERLHREEERRTRQLLTAFLESQNTPPGIRPLACALARALLSATYRVLRDG